MALRHAILAALQTAEASGYDLAKQFDVTVANYWTATPQQLYRELEKMDADGLVQARVIEQERRPNKRLYSVTAAGHAVLRDFVASEPRPTAIRDELMVQIEAMGDADADRIRISIQTQMEAAAAKLAHYEHRRGAMLAGRSEQQYLQDEPRIGPYLTLARGISFERENIAWARQVLAALATRGV